MNPHYIALEVVDTSDNGTYVQMALNEAYMNGYRMVSHKMIGCKHFIIVELMQGLSELAQ